MDRGVVNSHINRKAGRLKEESANQDVVSLNPGTGYNLHWKFFTFICGFKMNKKQIKIERQVMDNWAKQNIEQSKLKQILA